MLGPLGVPPLRLTEQAILDQAANKTAKVTVGAVKRDDTTLSAAVTVDNLAGHKLPSGVGVPPRLHRLRGARRRTARRCGPRAAPIRPAPSSGATGNRSPASYWWKDDCSGYARPGERPHQPHYQTITAEDQAQIYQELVAGPPANGAAVCGADVGSAGRSHHQLPVALRAGEGQPHLATWLPAARKPHQDRRRVRRRRDLAVESGPEAVGDDPDYASGGEDTLTYAIPLADLPSGASPASLRATLYYQATPPFFLQDRFCTAKGPDTERLYYLAGHLDLGGTAAEGWKLAIGSGQAAIP